MKIAIVTGASSGMGREFVRQLHKYVRPDEIWAVARRKHALEALCARIAAHAGIVGVVNMEFIVRGNECWFLEVNPRFSGGLGFSLAAGVDFTACEIACHDGDLLSPPVCVQPMTIVRRTEMTITEK